jgi:hypothetical protein
MTRGGWFVQPSSNATDEELAALEQSFNVAPPADTHQRRRRWTRRFHIHRRGFTPARKAQFMAQASGGPTDKLAPTRLRNQSRLVYDLMAFIRRYVVMTREQLLVTALWIIHTHCIEYV